MEIIIRAALIGIGGTITLDLYAFMLQRLFGVPATNWRMAGRWLGQMPGGSFIQPGLGQIKPIPGELTLGWTFHYLIGIAYGLLIVALWGKGWLLAPTLAEPLILALVLLVLPYFVMMPGMGMGMAGAKTSKPHATRLKSLAAHTIFGCGMYLTAWLMTIIF